MKAFYVIIILLLPYSVLCQAKPIITQLGADDGLTVENIIGKQGGKLISSDSKLELVVPPDAVGKDTKFTIQPVKNMLVLGLGNAYKLSPSGVRFRVPVQLVFHYDDDDAEEEMQSLLGVAMQDEQGKWFELMNTQIDTKRKTISGHAVHFSVWSKFMDLRISPRYAKLKVGAGWKMAMEVYMKTQDAQDPEIDQSTNALREILLEPSSSSQSRRNTVFKGDQGGGSIEARSFLDRWNAEWTVNGIPNGNSTFGTIAPASSTEAVYITPNVVPEENNPVTVTVRLQGFSYKKKGKTLNNPGLKSKILLFDNTFELKVEVEAEDLNIANSSTVGRAIYKDQSTMIFEVRKSNIKVREINNQDDYWFYEKSKCRQTVLANGTGMVHIGGIRASKVERNIISEGSPPLVEIDFTPVNTKISSVQLDCPHGVTKLAGGFMLGIRSYPMYVRFTASEGTQIIQKEGRRGGEQFLYIYVRKMTEEDNSYQ